MPVLQSQCVVWFRTRLLAAVVICSSWSIANRLFAADPVVASPRAAASVHFDLEQLGKPPVVYPAPDVPAEGVRTLFFEGLPYAGKPTRVFAIYGVPENSNGKKLPAMVLIHGGGGTAFERWVKVWTARGYAAISMDTCGCVPIGTYGNWQRHEYGGPPGWDASFDQLDSPIQDQWPYHAVSAAVLAHSLVRSFPEVDPERIGVTGISWGGYLTSIVAGVDPRFRFAVPVYGCGFLGENSVWLPAFERIGPEKARRWLTQWDPAEYLPAAKMPLLWVNGTNDFAYPMDSWQKSYRLPTGERTLCLRIRMPHGHGPAGEDPQEIQVFADQFLRDGTPLPKIVAAGHSGTKVWAEYRSAVPIVKAEVCFTRDGGKWVDRVWDQVPAAIDQAADGLGGRISGEIPADAKVFYLNLFDARDCVVSTEHVMRD